jgi:hypothetical protein
VDFELFNLLIFIFIYASFLIESWKGLETLVNLTTGVSDYQILLLIVAFIFNRNAQDCWCKNIKVNWDLIQGRARSINKRRLVWWSKILVLMAIGPDLV